MSTIFAVSMLLASWWVIWRLTLAHGEVQVAEREATIQRLKVENQGLLRVIQSDRGLTKRMRVMEAERN